MCSVMTHKELADLLKSAPATRIAKASGVCLKQVYRLRHEKVSPRLETVEKLLAALRQMGVPKANARAKARSSQ